MSVKITNKTYYEITFRLNSPLSIGSGKGAETDSDVVKNALGEPYIPASSLAGIYRDVLRDDLSEEDVKTYFGDVKINRGEEDDQDSDESNAKASLLKIYDAKPAPGEKPITIQRDMVSLDEFKTAKPGAKFDMEAVETGACFVTYVEQDKTEEADADIALKIAELWKTGKLCIGAKAMRGYGDVELVRARKAGFDLLESKGADAWLDFDMFGDSGWTDVTNELNPSAEQYRLILHLQLRGGISIRKYTTEVMPDTGKALPDYTQLTIKKDIPVIPGTTWAGAITHRMKELVPGISNHKMFGFVKPRKKTKALKSKIRFSESQIRNAKPKELTRNAIDRFSGGTVDNALFTERTFYGGKTELVISFLEKPDEQFKTALAAALTDLHFGLLAVGGLTSVGRGVFEIEKINDIETQEKAEDVFSTIVKALDFGEEEQK